MTGGRSPHGDLTAGKPGLWNAGLVTIDLPSGVTIRGVLPGLPELARQGLIPTELRTAALHFADPAWFTAEDAGEPERRERALEHRALVLRLVARFPRDVLDPETGGWLPAGGTIEERIAAIGTPEEGGSADPTDVDLLEDLVMRIRTPEEVSRRGRFLSGRASAEDAALEVLAIAEELKGTPASPAAAAGEAGDTVDALAGFRGDGDRAAPGAGGQPLRDHLARGGVPRYSRRRARLRNRRGAHAA